MKKIPVIGIGASAGGLKELECFFKNMPSSKDAAFVIIQHLSPNYKSILADIVTRYTEMAVSQIKDKTLVEVGKVYIIPPNKQLTLNKGKLILSAIPKEQKINLPIDIFFRSLKDNLGEKAVAVILSGTGSDGTSGIKEVKEAGGLTIVQQPDTADYDGMPLSAIKTGLIDFVIPVEEMPKVIIDYIGNEFKERENLKDNDKKFNDYISQIFELIKVQTGNDFSLYKKNTIYRRIERRLIVNKISNIKDYFELLKNSNTEVGILKKEFLISVTSFFRDVETFNYIKKHLVSKIVSNTTDNNLRIWIPACATGEEAYSWAMLFRNYIDDNKLNIDLQVFASDIDSDAIEKAREGFYTKNIISDVPKEVLERYFIEEKDGYHVKKSIRENVIFAEQNFLQDPPYSRLDMISCRNFLIYLDNTLQQKAISIAQYALNQEGVLVLGNSESLGNSAQYFKIIDRKFKIFQKIDDLDISSHIWKLNLGKKTKRAYKNEIVQESISDLAKEHILEKHTPPSVVIDVNGNMLFAQGRTGKYLEIATGEITTNIIKIARDGLKNPLSNALRKVKANNKELTHKNVRVKTNGDYEYVDVTVSPLLNDKKETKLYIVLFQSPKLVTKALSGHKNIEAENSTIYELEKELAEKEQYLQNIIEELESSNEEAQSTNEELQSTNEELETSKEELQSLNEELSTTNNELSIKVDEINKVNSQLKNLLSATNIATIFLDKKLQIFSFTPAISIIIQLQNSDIGRSITLFTNNLKYNNLVEDAEEVINTLNPKEFEVQNNDDHYFWMRILPYRNLDDSIEGVVITFTDITEKKKQEEELENYRDHLEELVKEKSAKLFESESILKRTESITRVGSWEWDIETDSIIWSDELHNIFSTNKEKGLPGYNKHKVIYTEDSQKLLDRYVKNAIEKGEPFETELEYIKSNGETGFIQSYGFPQINKTGKVEKLFGSVQEITKQKKDEQELIKAKVKAEESEKYLDNIVNNIGDPIFVKDEQSRLLVVNNAFCQIFGANKDDIIGKTLAEDVTPEERESFLKIDKQVLKDGIENVTEESLTVRGGSTKTIATKKTRFIDKNGGKFLVGVIRDITDRKKAEQALLYEKERTQQYLDVATVIMLSLDSNGDVLLMNPKGREILGYSNEEIIGMNWFEGFLPAEQRKEVKEVFKKTVTGNIKPVEYYENEVLCKDGTRRMIAWHNSALKDKDKKIIGVFSSGEDITERKKQEEELRQNAFYLKKAQEIGKIGTWKLDLIKDNLVWTEENYKIFGVPVDTKINYKLFLECIHPDDRDYVNAAWASAAKNKKPYDIEHRLLINNQPKWVREKADINYDSNGNAISAIGFTQDISKYKEAENIVYHEKEKFKILADNTFDWEYWIGPSGNYNYLSPACERITGYKPDEFIKKPDLLFDITTPKYKKQVKNHYNKITEKDPHSEEFVIINKNKEEIWIEHSCVPVYDEDGVFKGRRGVNRDITESKVADLKLKAAEENLKNTINISPGIICKANLNTGYFVEASQAVERILGYSQEEFTTKPLIEFVHPEDRQRTSDEISEQLKGNETISFENRYRCKDGSYKWLAWESTAADKEGIVFAIASNIEERKKSELEIIKAKNRAEESDRLKSAFLANMSHEIRTPMSGILGFTNLLKEPDLTGEQRHQFIEIIQKSGDRMLNTVNDIVEISRIEAGEMKVNSNAVNMNMHLLSLSNFFKLEAEKKGLELVVEENVHKEQCSIITDKSKLSSIISNLLKNAIKYTEKGFIKIGCRKNEKFLEFYVEDSGIGIPADRIDAVFNRFEQADIKDTRVFEGSGLGLAIAKSYVEMLGGKIWVDSEENRGSVFYFTIPHISAKPAASELKKKPTIRSVEKIKNIGKILIAEDEDEMYIYLSLILNKYTNEIIHAKNGNDTVELARSNPDIQLILMDIRMPGLDGYQATKKIREFNKDVVIIAQTAFALQGDREKAIKAGCNGYISKPINKEKLFELIRTIFKTEENKDF